MRDFWMSDQSSQLEQQVRSGRPVVSFTVGDSMEPLLYDRSTRVVICRADRPLQPGELPLYRRPNGRFIMHRIIRADAGQYYTRGDNRCGLEAVPREWVLGVVTEIYRGKHHFSVDHPAYRAYVLLWNAIYPLRWIVYKCREMRRRR